MLLGKLLLFPSYSQSTPYNIGEELEYNIYFKYGIVMAKAGSAAHKITASSFQGQPTIKSELSFRTSSTFDKIYKIRDTLQSHALMNANGFKPIYHKKYLHEGKTHYIEDLFFRQFSPAYSEVRSVRQTAERVKFDTILFSEGPGYDIVNIFFFVRLLDYSNPVPGQTFSIVNFMGKDVVRLKIRYQGQTILRKSETEKFKTLKFNIDIIDKAFEESKDAMEVWISDDDNRLPVKMKAKLKIGAAEAELSGYANLKHPFTSRIIIRE